MKKKKLKCYIYIRVSTSMQVEGYSLEAQRERLTKFADFQDIEIVREYCDAGKSGKNITGRPEFTQMLNDVAEDRDGVNFILVFKLSRFGRNAADVLNSLQYIQDFGVNLICVEDGIDSSKDSGKLTITVLSAVAEIERENILVQTMEGRKQKAREGKWNGGQAPFGYTLDSKKGMLLVNPDEAEIVKIIRFGDPAAIPNADELNAGIFCHFELQNWQKLHQIVLHRQQDNHIFSSLKTLFVFLSR